MTTQEDHKHLDKDELDSIKSTDSAGEESLLNESETPSEEKKLGELELLQAELENMKEKYIHCLAETENEKRRMQKDYTKSVTRAIGKVLLPILEPIDQFEKALEFAESMSNEVKNWATGFQMILTQFKEALHKQNIFSFDSLGKKYDPHRHDAISLEETEEVEEGIILEEFTKGYQYHGQIFRPAKVKVSKSPTQKTTNDEHNTENIT